MEFNLRQTKVSVANLYLQQYKDVAFASRGEWEERLFAVFDCTRAAQGDYVRDLDSVSKAGSITICWWPKNLRTANQES